MTVRKQQALTLTMFDVGQAECFLLEKGQKNALVDCGDASKIMKIVNHIKNLGITKLDYVFITHPHEDHVGGIVNIINNFQIGKIIVPYINQTKIVNKKYKELINKGGNENYQLEFANTADKYYLEDVEINVINNFLYQGNNINNYSIILKVNYGQNSILMTGDAEKQIEKKLLQTSENLKATILKIGHHGSKNATTNEFIDAIKPQYALISCGLNNIYNHPNKETIEKLNNQNVKIYRTDQLGTIKVIITENEIEFLEELQII